MRECLEIKMPKITNTIYASLAQLEEGELGLDFFIAMSKYGKGLFAARDLKEGEIITRYEGELIHDADLGSRTRTHMLRVPGFDYIWDGYPISRSLHYDRTTKLFTADDERVGFGAIANSSKHGNAKIKWFYNDLDGRSASYNPKLQKNFPSKYVRPKVPFLVASKPIDAGREILWKYQVELDPDETEVED
jgi:hypothetical protein